MRGGAADAAIWQKMVYAEQLANELRMPLVRLVDGTGGGGSVKSLETMGYTYVPFIPGWDVAVENLSTCPVAAAALGPVAGLGAARVVASHFSVIVRGTAQLFVAGPPVVAAAMGESPDKEELGGARTQTRAGAVDNEAADEDDALAQIKRFLSYLPSNVWEAPPVDRLPPIRATAARRTCSRSSRATGASPTRRGASSRRCSTAARCSRSARSTAGSLVTALARLDGRPVGVLASDPNHYGGGLTADASEKLTRFVDLCDQFHLPVVNFVDQPGFVIGTEAERQGTIRRGTRALVAVYQATRAVGVGPGAEGVRRRGRRARQRAEAQPPLRVAVGRLGIAADRGRHRGRLPPRARGGRGPGRAARRDRGAPERGALAVPHRGAVRRRGDHRPARHAAAAVRLGRAGARDHRPRAGRRPRSAAACAHALDHTNRTRRGAVQGRAAHGR